MKNRTFLLFLICISMFLDTCWCNSNNSEAELSRSRDGSVHLGVILNMGSWQGRAIKNSISMAISDFFRVRVVLHVRDSQGDPFRALSAAVDLLEEVAKLGAILGAETSIEAKLLSEFGERNKIPVISISIPSTSFPMSTSKSPFFVHVGWDYQSSQIKGTVALIELYKWRNVILILQEINDPDDDDDVDAMSYNNIVAFLEEKKIRISFVSSISTSSKDDQIVEQLDELKTLQTTVFIVHLPHSIVSRLFVHAERLGMVSKGYAWIVTSKSIDHFIYSRTSPMQGVLGFRSYVPASNQLDNFTSRLRRNFDADQAPDATQAMQLSVGLLAYNAATSLAKAAERIRVKVSSTTKLDAKSETSIYYRSMFLQEMLGSSFKGLGGEFRFINRKLISNKMFEIVNVMGSGVKRVGFCTSTGKITMEIYNGRRRLSDRIDASNNILEAVIWPGGSLTIPHGRMMQKISGKILKIGVPVRRIGFPQLVKMTRDPYTNATTFTGFCIDVFKAALEGLNYQVQYQFVPYMHADGNIPARTYSDLVHQVYLQNFDAVVGDTTITSTRSLYVDFTMPFTDIGVGIVASNKNKDMWIIFKPLTQYLWISIVGYHILSCYIIWVIEKQSRQCLAEDPSREPIRFFSVLVGRWEKLRNRWSMFIASVSVLIWFILSSSYTATLASMMTVQHFELNSKGNSYVGYQAGSNITKVLISNLNFDNYTLKPFTTTKEMVNALSKGSKNSGVSAIMDEIPYIKIFLADYSADHSLVKSLSTTNGFGFIFPKGSPLAPEISREIARLRESGRLNMLEDAWFKSQTSLRDKAQDAPVKHLTLTNFSGLFLICGLLSSGAFLIFKILLLYQSFDLKKAHDFFIKKFKRMRSVQSATVHLQQITSNSF